MKGGAVTGAAAVDGGFWILLEDFWVCGGGGGCRSRRDVVWRSCWLDLVVGLLLRVEVVVVLLRRVVEDEDDDEDAVEASGGERGGLCCSSSHVGVA